MADQIRPTPRSPILGLFSDLVNLPLQYMSDVNRTQQMRGMAEFIRSTGVPYALESLSYDPSGRGLFTGAGGLGGTTRLRPEAIEAALTVAPMVGPAVRVAGRGAMAVGRAGERYAERVVPQIMERGGLPAEMVSAMGQGTQSPLTVYHGSPYRFNRFDPTKIGSGEGAQAYGYGHYVAEAPGVAKAYRNVLSQGRAPVEMTLDNKPFPVPEINFSNPDPQQQQLARIRTLLLQERGDVDRAIARTYGDDVAALEKMRGRVSVGEPGALYKIDLPDEQIARMLDWDKPLSQQPKEIRDAINKTKSMLPANAMEDLGGDLSLLYGKDVTPNQFLNTWEAIAGRTGAGEEALRQAGIPGIRYLDQGSRSNFRVQNTYKGQPYGEPVSFMTEQQAKDYAAEQIAKGFGADLKPGTSNFVVFPGNEDLLRILEVNGEELLNPIMYRDPFGSTVR
jgi:hypothetical protein